MDILTNDLTRKQMEDPKYKLREGKAITTQQRSTVSAILRKSLGNPHVVDFIFQHDLPTLLDVPLRLKEAPTRALLQNMLEEFMNWHASLLQSILQRQKDPQMATARKLSDLDQTQWRRERRQRKNEIKQQLIQGAQLAQQNDTRKRKFEDMSATEQQILEDYDTRKTHKEHAKASGKRLPQFRGKMIPR